MNNHPSVIDLPMTQAAGSSLFDRSGYRNHFTFSDGVWTGSARGAAIRFNGTAFYEITPHPNFVGLNELTVACWCRSATGAAVAGHYASTGNQRSWLITNISTTMRVLLSQNGTLDAGEFKDYRTSFAAYDNAWHHLAFAFDGNSGSTLELYLDGRRDLAPTKTTDHAITRLHSSTTNPRIGRFDATTMADGEMAGFTLWRRALSPREILDHYIQTFPVSRNRYR